MKKFKSKYTVYDENGHKTSNCLVLRPDVDKSALMALEVYAETTDNEELSESLNGWINDLEWNHAQEYIGEDI